MNNNCKHLKLKLNKKLECKLDKNKIIPIDCANCTFKEYKMHNKSNSLCKNTTRNKKNAKLVVLEKNRWSLFTSDVNKCMFCESTYDLTWHEIFCGRNRRNSMKYGLCLRMCLKCHQNKQEDKSFNDFWHIKGQTKFEEIYPDLNFIDIFDIDYKHKKIR